MKKLTNEELEANYNTFIKAISKVFKGDRLEKLLHMYSMEELGSNLLLSPASGNVGFHNAYDGGYVEHIMNVVQNSMKVMKLYESIGGTIDFTQEELLFAAFHHDLGKLGYKNKMHYIHNPSDWHVKNQGKIYTQNPELSFLTHTDRTFFVLNDYGIKYTENEYLGIKLTDGLFDGDNEKYYKTYIPNNRLRNNIQYILHWADHMSSTIERSIEINAPF